LRTSPLRRPHPSAKPHAARDAAFGDLDNDGDISIVPGIMDGTPVVLRNDGTKNHWLGLALGGTKAHRSGTARSNCRVKSKLHLLIPVKVVSMKPVFTLADASDVELLIELMQEFYAIEHLGFNERAARGALEQILHDRRFGVIHLIRVDEAPAGYLVLTFGFSLEFRGRDAFVDELYLRASFRGRGIGKASLELADAVCRQEGISALHLEVERVNTRAQEVYRQAGFRDHDRYLLTKWLQ